MFLSPLYLGYFSFLSLLDGRLIASRVGGEHLVTGATGQASKGSQRCVGCFGRWGRVAGLIISLPSLDLGGYAGPNLWDKTLRTKC